MTGIEELAAIARSVAVGAGKLVLQADRQRPSRPQLVEDATRKSSLTDLATESDRASERFIVEQLRALRPNDGILGEEGSHDPGSTGMTWLVDPIDGTTNFVYGFPDWTVSIAVADDDGAIAGAVYEPVRDECFVAQREGGSTLNGRPLGPLFAPPLAEALIGTGFSYSPEVRVRQAQLLPIILGEVRDIRRAGAASLDLCYVATGRLDGYYEAMLKPWDRAAGLLVATEAGASFADLRELIPGQTTLVVAPGGLLSELERLLTDAAAQSDGSTRRHSERAERGRSSDDDDSV
jgi:myo-inositol-1(or 4)-monophosphatase